MFRTNCTPLTNLKQVLAGRIVLAEPPIVLQILGLGSCVAIAFYSPEKQIGALAHIMLPSSVKALKSMPKGKYADTAVTELVRRFRKKNILCQKTVIKIVGGSSMFFHRKNQMFDIAARNIEAVKEALKKYNLKIEAEATGGTKGRSILFNLETGEIQVYFTGGQLETIM
ncbi:MAG: chemotaxis protein CheD [Promethearchaeota archaeon]